MQNLLLYRVGGCVRDILACREPNDIDFVAIAVDGKSSLETRELLLKWLKNNNYGVFYKSDADDKLLLRCRHKLTKVLTDFTISPHRDIIEDLSERDFTINSMAIDEDGKTIDPFDGTNDLLKRRLIRTTAADASDTFESDPVRIIRALRLKMSYDLTLSSDIDDYLLLNSETFFKNLLCSGDDSDKNLKRLKAEFKKMLDTNTHGAIQLLAQYGNLSKAIFSLIKLNPNIR